MKKTFLLFTVLLFGFVANVICQYRPTLIEGNEWYVHYTGFGFDWNQLDRVVGDSVKNGTVYKKFQLNIGASIPEYQLYREDTLAQKIFKFVNDSVEKLVYDFSLVPGDTFHMYFQEEMVLDSITDTIPPLPNPPFTPFSRTLFLDNPEPRVFFFSSLDPSVDRPIIWVEGIGALSGFQWNVGNGVANDKDGVYCHFGSTGALDYHFSYHSPPDSCRDPLLSEDVPLTPSHISLYPNPATDLLLIETESAHLLIESITLYDSQGSLLLTQPLSPSDQFIDLTTVQVGILLVVIQLRDGRRITKKLIKQ